MSQGEGRQQGQGTLVRIRDDDQDQQQDSNSGWGWFKMLVPIVAAASAAAVVVHQHSSYEATRASKHALCGNPFMPPEELAQEQLEEGDLIEFRRSSFQHWGVYIGNGEVVHLNNDGKVLRVTLLVASRRDHCRVNNLEHSAKKLGLVPRPTRKAIVKYALAQVSDTRRVQYHVTDYNCEHFVTECFYGKAFSEQRETLDGQPIAKVAANVSARFASYD